MSTKLYVGNLSWNCTADDLRQAFGQFGSVEDAFIPTDRETGRSRGFGFVTMAAGDAQAAIDGMNEQEFMGRSVRVNEATPQGERSGGRGGGGGYGGRGGGGYDNFGGGRGAGQPAWA